MTNRPSDDAERRLRGGPRLDPAGPAFWEARYREGVMPWDAGRVPASLLRFLEAETKPLRVLVPGCGSGYEIAAFADAGHAVTAIDFSAAAVATAHAVLGPRAALVREADFFDFAGGPFDLVYERAFLCALPRRLWTRYAERMQALIPPGGRIAGFYFFDDSPRGPPFGLAAGELEALFESGFVREADEPVPDSLPVFAGRERWQVWRRR